MMIEQIIAGIFHATPFILVKSFLVVLLLLHLAFSFVLLRQIKTMTHVVEAQISPLLYSISVVHFFSSLFVFVWTMIFF